MEPKGLGRRRFLQVLGATGVAAGCSPPHAPEKLIPLLVPPENQVPGKAVHYRTVCRACDAGCGVTARTREGRAVKLEGNPDDPISQGALCARGQAQVQDLYSPERLRGPQRRGADGSFAAISWEEAIEAVAQALGRARGRAAGAAAGAQACRVRLLTRPEPGSLGELQRAFLAALGAAPAHRVAFACDALAPVRAAAALLFGRAELPVWELGKARSIVSFGADFLETWGSPVEQARGLAAGRGRSGELRTRFTWVGPRLSTTGASSDVFLQTRPGGERDAALLLLRWLVDPASGVGGLKPEARAVHAALRGWDAQGALARSGLRPGQIAALGQELARRRPSVLLGPGLQSAGTDATAAAAAILLCNLVLGNLGETVLFGLDAAVDPPAPAAAVRALLAEVSAGAVDVLLLHHADPVGDLPAALGAAAALGRAPLLVSFSDRLDRSTRLAHLVLPDHHPLESSGVHWPRRGVLTLQQPVMTPLAGTRAAAQTLIDLGAKLSLAGLPSEHREHARARAAARANELVTGLGEPAAFRELQARGVASAPVAPAAVAFHPAGLEALLDPAPPSGGEGLALVPFPTALPIADPDAAPWLREVPDLIGGLSWSGWAELSPAAAASIGAKDGELVSLSTPAGQAQLPLRVSPALHDEAVAVPASAPELLALLGGALDLRSGALAPRSLRARIAKAGPAQALVAALGPMSRGQEGRDLARAVSAASPRLPPEPEHRQMAVPHGHPVHQWAMVIDLDRCSGCQACVVACYAENNIPVNGPEFAAAGRNMAWLRIQRTFEARKEGGVKLRVLPSLCQHCHAAPCEPVCPVSATYHNPEGLNAQVYNRCIGTRYCSNNCPYDARVFNWKDPLFAAPLDLQLNPDVSVRGRGIMEKCTFCVQRIRGAEHAAKDERRLVADGEVVPACVQTCPSQAMVFGDRADPESRVSRLAGHPRGYALMAELNTLPSITYLARIEDES